MDTLIIYDAGNLYVHGIYVNISDGVVSSGQVCNETKKATTTTTTTKQQQKKKRFIYEHITDNHSIHHVYIWQTSFGLCFFQIVKPYLSPIPPQTHANPFVFLVFKQPSSVSLSDATKQELQQTTDLQTVVKALQLRGFQTQISF